MSHRVTKATVESVVASLNYKAELLGLDRRFEFRPGSGTNGVAHALEEHHPALFHPTTTKIGKTLSNAYDYVLAMNHALGSVISDRDHRRRSTNRVPHLPHGITLPLKIQDGTPFADPDARSVRRQHEQTT